MSKANTQTATDTNVLVGLDAVNGFYTPFFVQEILPGCIKNALGEWDGSDAVVKNLRSLRAGYTTICNNTIALDRREAIQDYLDQWLDALGYDIAADPVTVRSARQESITVRTQAMAPDGDMCVQVLTCSDDDAETGILESVMDDGNLTGEQCVHALLSDEEHASRWILLLGLHQAALIDRMKWADRRYLLFDFDVIYARNEATTYKAVAALLSKHDLCPREGTTSVLDDFEEQANAQSVAVSNNLRYALRECVELLGNEVIHDWTENKHKSVTDIDADELTMECLRYMYRLLFLLFIEAKPELGYAPMKAASYRTAYSLESLRDLAESMRGRMDELEDTTYTADTLHILDEIIYNGYPAKTRADDIRVIHGADEAFTLPPLKAHIFDPERTHLIEDAELRDSVMLHIIDMMSVSSTGAGKARRRQRIAYSSLGISQMGAIYEGLLSYRGFIATTTLYEVKRDKDKFDPLDVGYFVDEKQLEAYSESERVRYESGPHEGELRTYEPGTFIYRMAGRERETSASFYTPDSLARCLVKYALKVIEPRIHKAADILTLRICEPAMGSATFLNETVNQLAEWYLRLREQELVDEQGPGAAIPADERQAELQKVKMLIADRNVYGVDLNPVAVELAEVALWLNSICPGSFIPWFGDQLICGNSLIGARRRAYMPAELTTATKGMQWYCHEPQRVALTPKARHGSRIYHFLTGDPGMCSYSDKIVKSLEPEHIAAMKKWAKTFTKPYSDDDIALMQRLSTVIDHLWRGVVDMRRQLSATTHDALKVYGWQGETESGALPVSTKDALLNQSYHSIGASNAGEYARLKLAMDYWCALWFWPIEEADLLPTRDEYLHDMQLILNGEPLAPEPDVLISPEEDINEALANELGDMTLFNEGTAQVSDDEPHGYMMHHTVNLDELVARHPRLQLVRKVSEQQRFFHWELEFADVFADGGFDFMVGNPPWVKLQWKASDALADADPQYAIHQQSASDLNKVLPTILGSSGSVRQHFIGEYEAYAGQSSFFNAMGNYPLLQGQQTNLFRCFLPHAWDYTQQSDGVSAFIHPDEVYADIKAGVLREQMLKRLKYHFQFINEKRLFAEVHPNTVFSLNIYSNQNKDIIKFDSIWKLYLPVTIDECYSDTSGAPVQPMKTADNEWNTKGFSDRIIVIDTSTLDTYVKLANENVLSVSRAPLFAVYAKTLLRTLECLAQYPYRLGGLSKEDLVASSMWDETNGRKDGAIESKIHFPEKDENVIYSSAFIGMGNPLLQSTRKDYKHHKDYDLIDLTSISDNYEPRVKYTRGCGENEYHKRMMKLSDGTPFDAIYRIGCRGMVDVEGERTLFSAILPPHVGWVNAIKGYGFNSHNYSMLALMLGTQVSLPLDYLIRSIGKSNIHASTFQLLPVVKSVVWWEIAGRGLLLNCLTNAYAELWHSCWNDNFTMMRWAKEDSRLLDTTFSMLRETWNHKTPLRSEYSRRQALVELDVLVAMALGMTLEELIDVYRLTFPILKTYENETWYDSNGRVIYSKKRSYAKISMTRDEFDQIRDEQDGFVKTITVDDDTLPDGPIKRDISFVAPYDRCDRIEDYRTAWAFFEAKYGEALARERIEREAMRATKAE